MKMHLALEIELIAETPEEESLASEMNARIAEHAYDTLVRLDSHLQQDLGRIIDQLRRRAMALDAASGDGGA